MIEQIANEFVHCLLSGACDSGSGSMPSSHGTKNASGLTSSLLCKPDAGANHASERKDFDPACNVFWVPTEAQLPLKMSTGKLVEAD
jgi:hypothetical protein